MALPSSTPDQDPTRNILCITQEDSSVVCIFCKSSRLDDLNLGPMYQRDGVVTHYFCMLFSAALKQNGADDEGILGFLTPDILKEVRRSFKLKCCYCYETGASVGCCNKRCKEIFHFRCGVENGANFQFHSKFQSYCAQHVKHKPHFNSSDWADACPICMSKIGPNQKIVSGSCCKLSIFHKECIQKMALSAGYFFKCPMCNRTKHFVHEMRSSGIFVPEQDASWEKDNGFQDLYVRYSNCDAENCACRQGRTYFAEKGSWALARCRLCGAAGIHKFCGKLDSIEDWACEPCFAVECKAESESKTVKPSSNSELPGSSVNLGGFVSGNPRVSSKRSRPCRRKLKTRKDDEEFKMTKVKISRSCFSYFPYSRDAIRKLQQNTIPDWRNMQLRVNLCKWIPTPCLPLENFPISRATNSTTFPSPQSSCKLKRVRSILEMEAEEAKSDRPAPLKSHKHRGARSRRGGLKTRWSTGFIKGSRSGSKQRLRKLKKKALSTASYHESAHLPLKQETEPFSICCPNNELVPSVPPPAITEEEMEVLEIEETKTAPDFEIKESSQGTEHDGLGGIEMLLSPCTAASEPTPEQVNSFKALGDRLRTELSQNTNNNRENEVSTAERMSYFSSFSYKKIHRRKQWFSPERTKERQVFIGDSEL